MNAKTAILKSPAYIRTVEFIAYNDEEGEERVKAVSGFISVITASVAFGIAASTIAKAVVKLRRER